MFGYLLLMKLIDAPGKLTLNLTIADDKKIRSHKSYSEQQPKLYKPYIKKAAQDKEIQIIDMNDKEKFGVVLLIFHLAKPLKKLLADYRSYRGGS